MNRNRSRTGIAALLSSIYLVCYPCGSSGQQEDEKVDVKNSVLPEGAADQENFSRYQPTRPYSVVGEVLARTVLQANGPGSPPANAPRDLVVNAPSNYHVEVIDWAIPARKGTGTTTLPGAAFFEVRSGSGTLVAGKQQEFGPGATFTVSQGQSFEIKNGDEWPLQLRIYVVKD